MVMDKKDHKKRHIELHQSLDELLADLFMNTQHRTNSTIKDLMEWSYKQTLDPDHEPGG